MTVAEAREQALRFLGHRDYTALELRMKLRRRGASSEVSAEAVHTLEEDGLLDEQRYAEVYCHMRMGRHYGPLKIRAELRGKGIADPIIESVLPNDDEIWIELIGRFLERKRRGEFDQREKARLYRSGCGRGFTHAQVMKSLDGIQ